MILFLFVLVFGCLLPMAGLVLWILFSRLRDLNESYRRLAEKYNGEFYRASTWDEGRPSAWFVHQGVRVFLSVRRIAGKLKSQTQLHISWPESDMVCEVRPNRAFRALFSFFDAKTIKTGSRWFDAAYTVRGDSPHRVGQMLSPYVQTTLHRLTTLAQVVDPQVVWERGALMISANEVLRSHARLESFVALALKLYEYARATEAEGIAFQQPEERLSSDASCPLCREHLAGKLVLCRDCQTPHHLECWKFYGACSVYGCGQRKYISYSAVELRSQMGD